MSSDLMMTISLIFSNKMQYGDAILPDKHTITYLVVDNRILSKYITISVVKFWSAHQCYNCCM